MIILAILLVIICIFKLCCLLGNSNNIEADCNSLPISKETTTSIVKSIIVLESLIGIFCGLFIIFAL